MDYRIFPPEEMIECGIALPPSKSIDARRLCLNYVAGEKAVPLSGCDDIEVLSAILSQPLPTDGSEINVGESGTAMRFLTALCAAWDGVDCVLTGAPKLCTRPVGPLVHVLRMLGAHIEYLAEEGYPPMRIHGARLAGGTVDIDASMSSQFVSALMIVTPLLRDALCLRLMGKVQSMPYINMTAQMLRRRGANVDFDRDKVDTYAPEGIKPGKCTEPDWSAAAFWYEIAALSAGWITLEGMTDHSLQGDRAVAPIFERLGVLTEFTEQGAELSATPEVFSSLEVDLSDMPDAVPALAVTACMVGVPFRYTGVAALQLKESRRLDALCAELAKVGCRLEIEAYGDVLSWDGRRTPIHSLPEFDTYNDHRIAMALAPVALYIPGIVVRGAECVAKSYPAYWEQLQSIGFTMADPADPMPEQKEE